MSWQQSTLVGLIRVLGRLRLVPDMPRMPEPPPSVSRVMATRNERIAGVPCVRLGTDAGTGALLVYLHGGAYVNGPFAEQWTWIGALARRSGIPAIMVDYALSGEHPYPYAIDQVLHVIAALGTRPIILVGDSAGGGLAVAVAARLRDLSTPAAALVVVSPWLDVTLTDPAAAGLEATDVMLSIAASRADGLRYAGDSDPRSPGISPLYGDATGLPRTLAYVGTREIMLPDVHTWTANCRAAGVDITTREIVGGPHDGVIAIGLLPEARRALVEQVDFVLAVSAAG